MSKLSIDLDFIADDLNGNDPLTHYAVLNEVGRWLSQDVKVREVEDAFPHDIAVMALEGPGGGWPLVRFTGTLPFMEAVLRTYCGDDVEQAAWLLREEVRVIA